MTDLMFRRRPTRACTFQIGHEMSGRAYPEVGWRCASRGNHHQA
jgi:hypothetical protein